MDAKVIAKKKKFNHFICFWSTKEKRFQFIDICALIQPASCLFVSTVSWFGAGMKEESFFQNTRHKTLYVVYSLMFASARITTIILTSLLQLHFRLIWKLDRDCIRHEVRSCQDHCAAPRDGRTWSAAVPNIYSSSISGDKSDIIRKISHLGV